MRCALALATAFLALPALAQDAAAPAAPPEGSVGGLGDINLFPKRVVLDGRRQIAEIGLYNKTTNSGDYAIELVDMAMTPDGQLLALDNGVSAEDRARVKTASSFLRYSPRRLTLRGGDSQLVRLMARAAPDLPPGEYRSHFLVVSVPPDAGMDSIDGALAGQNASGIGVTIRPRFGISIPVIVRVGETTLQAGIGAASLVATPEGGRALAITLTRSGTRSAFGDIVVTAQGTAKPVALARGIGIYPEVSQRTVVVPLDPEAPPAALAPGTRWTISYLDDDAAPGTRLAESGFVVP